MPAKPLQVLIIGGGIAGPVLALFLKQAGFSPQIFESSSSFSEAGGALGLAPNGMNVLAAAGVAEQVRSVSVTGDEWAFENQFGKLLACAPAGEPDRYGQPTVMIIAPRCIASSSKRPSAATFPFTTTSGSSASTTP